MREPDLRVQKTQEAIESALLSLIGEKGFDGVTVRSLCLRARINRSTFYAHYQDKYDLLDQITQKAIQKIVRIVNPEEIVDGNGKINLSFYHTMVLSLFRAVEEDRTLYQNLLGVNGNYNFLKELKKTVKEKILAEWDAIRPRIKMLPIDETLYLEIIVSIFVGAVLWWIDENFSLSSEVMAEQLVRYVTSSISLWGLKAEGTNLSFLNDIENKLSGKRENLKNY
ncbi:TetR/AcrR family transcriptional regulator [Caproicibacter sp.]|uniref:TetR/AcrR family transcriptional regulator n=1 Tax=Caproicibacter sp. TaxID=2814884 RepID=UPI003988AFA4